MMFTSSPRSVSQVAKAPDLQHVNAARAAPAATAVATHHALAVGDGRELVQLELDLGLRRIRRRGLHNHLIHLLRFRSQGAGGPGAPTPVAIGAGAPVTARGSTER